MDKKILYLLGIAVALIVALVLYRKYRKRGSSYLSSGCSTKSKFYALSQALQGRTQPPYVYVEQGEISVLDATGNPDWVRSYFLMSQWPFSKNAGGDTYMIFGVQCDRVDPMRALFKVGPADGSSPTQNVAVKYIANK